MAAYEYLALDHIGHQKRGALEADSERQVRQALRERGLVPLSVEIAAEAEERARGNLLGRLSGRMSALDLALVTRQLATLVRAALPVEEALRAVAAQTEKRAVRNIVLGVRAKVLEGHSLAAGMADYPRAFPDLYRATIAAGEQSGFLDRVLENLASYTERRQQSRQNVQMALVYPIILACVALAIVTGLMLYVVPDIVKVFEDAHQELPLLTKAMIATSAFLQDWLAVLLLAIAAAFVAGRMLYAEPRFRRRFDRWILGVPIVGRISRGANAAQFAGTLAVLTSSGVPLVDALHIAAKVLTNVTLREHLSAATQRVSEGTSLATALEGPARLPPMMLHMIASGEASGQLDTMLGRIATYQQDELERLVTALVKLFEPAMVLVMAGVVLTIVLAILLPIINLNQMVMS